jgi:fluoroquinolone transport system permease protein
MTSYNHLIKSDWKLIGRDPMLLMSMFAPFLIMCVAVFGVPYLSDTTETYFNFPLDGYFPIIHLFFLPLTPMLFGMVYGFILLDERDAGLISYLSVTPIGKSGYLLVRMLMPILFSFLFSISFFFATDLGNSMSLLQIILFSAVLSSEAPMMLLFLGAIAGNKVEGIALSKGFGILLISMVPDYFFDSNWLLILSVSPLWWIERALFHSENTWFYLAGAALMHTLFIVVLYRRFSKRLG